MDGQLVGVAGLIAAAVAYLGRATWRTWFGAAAAGCGSGCGKCPAATAPPPEAAGRRISLL